MNPKSFRAVRAFALCFAALTLASLPSQAQSAPQQRSLAVTRITQAIDESRLVTLKGNVHPLAQARFDRGAAPASMPTGRIMLLLQGTQQQQTALKQYLDSLQNPGSPSYHKWLTPEQYGALYGPTEQDVQTVSAWLQSQGFEVSKVAKARNMIEFSGSVAQVQQAFHTEIHSFVINGRQHYANISDPQIPAALAPVVAGVASLNDFRTRPGARLNGPAHFDPTSKTIKPDLTLQDPKGNNYLYVDPADAATIYDTPNTNLNRNYKSGTTYDGTGITIGIAGDSNLTTADVANYRTLFLNGQNPSALHVIIDGNDPGINGDEIEALLDTEVAGALAPGANINFYTSADTDLQSGLFLAIFRALDDNTVSILNLSFGACEANEGAAGNQQILAAWQQAAAQGISVTTSTGDSGSAACDNPNTEQAATGGLAVSGIASTPYNIAVGGTDYDVLASNGTTSFNQYVDSTNGSGIAPYYGTALGYIPEVPWNDSASSNAALSANTPFKDSNGNTNIVAAGGGASSMAVCGFALDVQTDKCPGNLLPYPKPAFQSSLTPNDKARDLPDVSLLASDGAYGATWVVCLGPTVSGTTGTDCQPTTPGTLTGATFSGVGGTSAAAPAFAGMLALVAQSQAAQGKNPRLGQADTVLYALAKSNPAVFHDVTTGNNSVYCSGGTTAGCGANSFMTGYNAGTGYDLASGLGSVDATQMVNNWSSVSFAATTTSLTVNGSTAAVNVQHGTPLTFAATVAPGSATGTVTLLTNSTLPNNSFQFQLPLTNGSASGSYNGLPGGTYNVYGYYGGDSTNAASSSNLIPVTISPEGSKTLLLANLYDATTGQSLGTNVTSAPYGSYVTVNAHPYGVASTTDAAGNIIPDGIATGTVAFFNGTTSITQQPLQVNSQGVASYNSNTLAPGSYNFTGNYSGDLSMTPSTSNAAPVTIVQGTTQTTVAASAAAVTSATSVTLMATIATDSLGDAPTGTVTFFSGTTAIGSAVAVKGGVDPKTGLVNATATLAVTGAQLKNPSSAALNEHSMPWGFAGGGAAMAFALFFAIPARRRSWRALLGLMLFAALVSTGIGCGSSSGIVSSKSSGITAKYSGDTNYTASTTTAAVNVIVTQ